MPVTASLSKGWLARPGQKVKAEDGKIEASDQ